MKRMHFYIGGAAGMIALLAILGAWFERISIKAEAKRKANWIANFPFQPTPHPTLTFDPEVMNLDVDERGFPIETEEYKVMNRLLRYHRSLKTMYEDHEAEMYSPEFEKMHQILSEYLDADPYTCGRAFTHLVWYHGENLHDPESLYSSERTWNEKKAETLASFRSALTRRKGLDGKRVELLSMEKAIEVRDRLIAELPAEVMLQHRPIIPHYKYQKMLEAGDALLIR